MPPFLRLPLVRRGSSVHARSMSDTLPLDSSSRRLPLASAFNLRDFGGYATQEGRFVRRGMLYRSGTMSLLTKADAAHLRSLGIRAICDFRRPGERAAEPTSWHHGEDVDYYCRDYHGATGVLSEMLRDGAVTPAVMREAMMTVYREIATDHVEAYRAMFERLAAGRVPMLINCAAGKDRTGAGAAMILALLGVPRETIFEDYLLTNVHADWDWRLARGESRLGAARRAHAAAIEPVLIADAAYLDALFAHFDAAHGGIDGYLTQALGVDDAARAAIRDLLLEP